MDTSQKDHARRRFAIVAPVAPASAALFYGRPFELDPQTRALFRYEPASAAMARQGAKPMRSLGAEGGEVAALRRACQTLDLAHRAAPLP